MATDVTPPPAKPSPEPPFSVTPTVEPPPSTPSTAASRPPEPGADVIHIPSYTRWFTWNAIHECEVRFVPEFFDGRSSSKNPRAYKYYRNAIIRRFRENPTRKITFTEVRKTIVGDVGSIRRLFDFLEAWGLINYAGGNTPKQPQQLNKETKSAGDAAAAGGGADVTVPKNTLCSGCKAPCTVACFASDKHDMTLCRRCYYVRCNNRVGLSSADFKRVEISEEAKMGWSDKEILQLLEAVMHYGDDWKKVAKHVGGRNAEDCVARFIKLPFAQQFGGPPESGETDTKLCLQSAEKPTKRQRLSPLADASNPIMAQAAFLSTLAGVDVAEASALAAVAALSDVKTQESLKAPRNTGKRSESDNASNDNNPNLMEGALVEANFQLDTEENELEKAISAIASETKEIEENILHFDEIDLQMEKKCQLIKQLQDLLFVDKLSLLFRKADATEICGE